MKLKVNEIEVPPDSPFTNDVLGREPLVKNLITLLTNSDTPIVFSLNAEWGTGKTVFLKMLAAQLKLDSYKSIYFNAWETDFAADPMLSFLAEIRPVLEEIGGENDTKKQYADKAISIGKHLLRRFIPLTAKMATGGLLDLDYEKKLLAEELLAEEQLKEYTQAKDEISNFKEAVGELLSNKDGTTSKIYILVDELDRCRPSYALELLERIKHLFEIEGLIFVLSMDRSQLAHSVKAVYGSDFLGSEYLRRFINMEYTLPEPNRDDYIDNLLKMLGYEDFFQSRAHLHDLGYNIDYLKNSLKLFCNAQKLPLRQIEHLMARANLVLRVTPTNTQLYPHLMVFLLVAREYHTAVYSEYIRNSDAFEPMLEILYELIPDESQRFKSRECAVIEGLLIAANHDQPINTSAQKAIEAYEVIWADKNFSDSRRIHAHTVVDIYMNYNDRVALHPLVDQIEMIAEHVDLPIPDQPD